MVEGLLGSPTPGLALGEGDLDDHLLLLLLGVGLARLLVLGLDVASGVGLSLAAVSPLGVVGLAAPLGGSSSGSAPGLTAGSTSGGRGCWD